MKIPDADELAAKLVAIDDIAAKSAEASAHLTIVETALRNALDAIDLARVRISDLRDLITSHQK